MSVAAFIKESLLSISHGKKDKVIERKRIPQKNKVKNPVFLKESSLFSFMKIRKKIGIRKQAIPIRPSIPWLPPSNRGTKPKSSKKVEEDFEKFPKKACSLIPDK